jgi:hypothetical protein
VVKPTSNCKFWIATAIDAALCLGCEDGYGPITEDAATGNGFAHTLCVACPTGCDSCDGDNTETELCTEPSEGYYLITHSDVTILIGECFPGCYECVGPFLYDCTRFPGFGLET